MQATETLDRPTSAQAQFQCIRCAAPLSAQEGDFACAGCSFPYSAVPNGIKYNADPLLFENYKKKFLLYKVLNNNGYISYQYLHEGSVSLPGRSDVAAFRAFIESAVPAGRILDIGCGILPLPGYLDFANKGGYELFGLDPIEETQFQGVRIIGCSEYLPLADEFFDAVIFATSLDHVCSMEKTASEALRVLKPGGNLLIWMSDRSQTLVQRAKGVARRLALNVMRGYRTDKFYVYPNLTVLYAPKGAVDAFHSFAETPAKVKKLMCGAGFVHAGMQYDNREQVFLRFVKPEAAAASPASGEVGSAGRSGSQSR
ncbi:MAG: class I SAM-dependent methyltransferase [Allosphingosinicella sp.]|uniref:class I SAM-dependent methyltransferase n=1 Tax=Allosphingosinicella sp. TaxID=2823234 RepID=UPI003953948B